MSDQTTMAMCSCNSIKLSLHGDPQESMACYCVDCQKAAGGPCTTDVVFPQDKVDIMDPEHVAKEWSQKGITGGNKTKVFCGNCGCTMIVKSEAFNDQIIVRTGVIEGGPSKFPPKQEVFAKDRPQFCSKMKDTTSFNLMPSMQG